MVEGDHPDYEGRKDLGNIYKGDGERFIGRGLIQITGRNNYTDWSHRLGVDLVGSPELATVPEYAAKIAAFGMRDGTFTGRNLARYINDDHVDFYNARNIVNGRHDAAQTIAGYTEMYRNALRQCAGK